TRKTGERAARRVLQVRRMHARLCCELRAPQDAGARCGISQMESRAGSKFWRRKETHDCAAKTLMILRILHSKNLVACFFAAATGLFLHFRYPFPADNLFLELTYLRARPVFLGAKYFYMLFLYTTPYIVYSIALSGIYIAILKIPSRERLGQLPPYPASAER